MKYSFRCFSTSWDTPFIDIMRIFSEILLKNEHRETSLAAALPFFIFFPLFLSLFFILWKAMDYSAT